ncbi:N-acyl-phosphatidylethanolamine-hydrolyzing phospholipase D isoform X3 [Lepeophtheirus salmonis]|uniref:N-acyl-phosphatidylethanolamine-hydrolyzing phospholipase D isoform X3 n=1 Tax=Lepeophtheirus salmonis TaxID=72036 RepID=UPI001AE58483|nr:N-acyl-phosphatidylethanolamine-hydrolyzing phospholipase D-like isoform X3 [Lepeophtheirus salmonis]
MKRDISLHTKSLVAGSIIGPKEDLALIHCFALGYLRRIKAIFRLLKYYKVLYPFRSRTGVLHFVLLKVHYLHLTTWLGHASVWVDFEGFSVLTDPIFSERASPFSWSGPKRYRGAPCTISELPGSLNAVVISHSHYDHCDLPSLIELSSRYGTKLHWFVPSGMKSWMLDYVTGITENNVKEMEWWDEFEFQKGGFKIIFTPSDHWSRRGAFDENKVLWGSWVIEGNGTRVFFGGDTAYNDEAFKQIKSKLGSIDLGLIPIGAYEPRWFMQYVHVNPEEAVKIHQDLGAKKSLGVHWGTFKLTYEPYLEPKSKIRELATDQGLDFTTINIGESLLYP